MTFSFHPAARAEFDGAIDYYEQKESGLGWDFAIEVHSAIQNIVSYPTAWPALEGEIRRCLTKRFPFGVIYVIGKTDIHILAVMHLHRQPDYWKVRG